MAESNTTVAPVADVRYCPMRYAIHSWNWSELAVHKIRLTKLVVPTSSHSVCPRNSQENKAVTSFSVHGLICRINGYFIRIFHRSIKPRACAISSSLDGRCGKWTGCWLDALLCTRRVRTSWCCCWRCIVIILGRWCLGEWSHSRNCCLADETMDTPFSRQLALTAEHAATKSAIPVSDDFGPGWLDELLRRQQLVVEDGVADDVVVAITSWQQAVSML